METYANVRFLAKSPLDDENERKALLLARGHTVEMFVTAAELRTRVCGIMTEHPELVGVVQNPPNEYDVFQPLGALVHTPAEAIIELSPYHAIKCADDDWTPMVVWFVVRDEDAHAEISVDHAHPILLAK